MTNIAMENGPFINDFPVKPSIYKGFSMAMLNNQRVTPRTKVASVPATANAAIYDLRAHRWIFMGISWGYNQFWGDSMRNHHFNSMTSRGSFAI